MKSIDELLRALPPAANSPDDREVIVTVAEIQRYVRAAVLADREAIAGMIENATATNADGERLHDLGHWESEWFVLDADKLAAAIRSLK